MLFLDATNSDRSQIAEGLLRLRAGEMFEVCSAGLKPQPILEDTRRVLREAGVNPEGLRPKSVGEFLARVPVRYGITLGQRGEPHAPRIYPFAARTWHWDCPVPRRLHKPAAQLAMLRESATTWSSALADGWIRCRRKTLHAAIDWPDGSRER